ncbi:hypothetical protein D3C80_1367980 [compost metagenome]
MLRNSVSVEKMYRYEASDHSFGQRINPPLATSAGLVKETASTYTKGSTQTRAIRINSV